MKREHITNLLLLIIALLLAVNLFVALTQSGVVDVKIQTALKQYAETVKIPEPIKPKDGYTPRKNIDYFDGKPGENGLNATDEQVEKAVEKYFKKNPVKKPEDGKDGKTQITECNTEKNRWETRFGLNEAWQLLGGKETKCTTEVQQ